MRTGKSSRGRSRGLPWPPVRPPDGPMLLQSGSLPAENRGASGDAEPRAERLRSSDASPRSARLASAGPGAHDLLLHHGFVLYPLSHVETVAHCFPRPDPASATGGVAAGQSLCGGEAGLLCPRAGLRRRLLALRLLRAQPVSGHRRIRSDRGRRPPRRHGTRGRTRSTLSSLSRHPSRPQDRTGLNLSQAAAVRLPGARRRSGSTRCEFGPTSPSGALAHGG